MDRKTKSLRRHPGRTPPRAKHATKVLSGKMDMKNSVFFLLSGCMALLGLISSEAVANEDPSLVIRSQKNAVAFRRSELLKHPAVETVVIKKDPAYPGKEMQYRAIPAWKLMESVDFDPGSLIQFKALDGFSAPVSKERLLNQRPKASIAYVAIEEPGKEWPALKPSARATAGPFYLVWKNPELSKISPEEWPFQLASFEEIGTISAVYPKILPDSRLPSSDPAQRGFEVFRKNCFACHTLNLSGASQVGPDLNVPMNPTEYFSTDVLKKLIRDPQSVKHFPQSKMNAFPQEVLEARELDDLIAYLRHMAERKQAR